MNSGLVDSEQGTEMALRRQVHRAWGQENFQAEKGERTGVRHKGEVTDPRRNKGRY